MICLSILGVSLCTPNYLNLRTVSPETPWLVLPHPATTAVLFRMCWWPVGRQTVPLHSITIGENHPQERTMGKPSINLLKYFFNALATFTSILHWAVFKREGYSSFLIQARFI